MTPQRQKEVGVVVFVIAFSVGAFLLTSLFVHQGRFNLTVIIVILTSAAWLWAALVTFALGMVQHPGSSAAIVLGVPAALALVGVGQLPALVAALLLITLLSSARHLVRSDVISRLRYRPTEMFTRGARLVVFGVIVVALGIAWPALSDRLAPAEIRLPIAVVEAIVGRVVPALPHVVTGAVDPRQLTTFVVTVVNQQLQSIITTYRSAFTLTVIAAVVLAWRELVIVLAWPVVWLIGFLVSLARRIGFVYISRSQATIEQLHL